MRKKRNATNLQRGCRVNIGAIVRLLLLIVLSAYVMALAVAAPKLPWLGFIALIPLLRVIQVQRPRAAMFAGAVWGATLYVFGTTVADTGIAPSILSFAILIVLPAAYAFLGARLTRWIGFSPFVLSVGWMLVELGFAHTGLNHGLLAGTQGDGLLIGVVGHLLGYVLVAFVVAYASALLLTVVSGVRFRFDFQVFRTGLDEVGTCLWRLIPIAHPCVVAGPSFPRAPPLRRSSL